MTADGVTVAILTGLQSARWPSGDRLVDADAAALLIHVVPRIHAELARRGLLIGCQPENAR